MTIHLNHRLATPPPRRGWKWKAAIPCAQCTGYETPPIRVRGRYLVRSRAIFGDATSCTSLLGLFACCGTAAALHAGLVHYVAPIGDHIQVLATIHNRIA